MRATANLALFALATQSTNAIFCFVKEKKCLPGVGLSFNYDKVNGLLGMTETKSAAMTGTAIHASNASPTPAMDAAVPTPEADKSKAATRNSVGPGFLGDIFPMRELAPAPQASPLAAAPVAEAPAAPVALPPSPSPAPPPAPSTVALYGQCGAGSKGQWSGPTKCTEGTCVASQDYYSCLPGQQAAAAAPAPAAPPAQINQAAPAGPGNPAAASPIVPEWIRELIPRDASLQPSAPPAYNVPVYESEVYSTSLKSATAYLSEVGRVTSTTTRYTTVAPTLIVSHPTTFAKSSAPYKDIHSAVPPQPSAPYKVTSEIVLLTTTVDIWVHPTSLSTSTVTAYTSIAKPSEVPVSPIYPAPNNETRNVAQYSTATKPKPTIYVIPIPANSTLTPEAYIGAAPTNLLNAWCAIAAGVVALMAL